MEEVEIQWGLNPTREQRKEENEGEKGYLSRVHHSDDDFLSADDQVCADYELDSDHELDIDSLSPNFFRLPVTLTNFSYLDGCDDLEDLANDMQSGERAGEVFLRPPSRTDQLVSQGTQVVRSWLKAEIDKLKDACDGVEDSRRPSPVSNSADANPPNYDSGKGKRAAGTRKRRERGDDDGDKDSNDDGSPGTRRAKRPKRPQGRRFACPYFKRDPMSFNHGPCWGPGWENFSRTKEHVMRNHALPPLCPRCQVPFPHKDLVKQHLRDDAQCSRAELRKRNPLEGHDEGQREELKGRMPTNMKEDDKWRHMYRILFHIRDEDVKLPSPYYNQYEDFVSMANGRIENELPGRIHAALELESELSRERITTIIVQATRDILDGLAQGHDDGQKSPATSATPSGVGLRSLSPSVGWDFPSLTHYVSGWTGSLDEAMLPSNASIPSTMGSAGNLKSVSTAALLNFDSGGSAVAGSVGAIFPGRFGLDGLEDGYSPLPDLNSAVSWGLEGQVTFSHAPINAADSLEFGADGYC